MSSRFGFGKNWSGFLRTMSDERLQEAQKSLESWFGTNDLSGKSFLDIGSGSGLFSLAARSLGAKVHSFDYDTECVKCTQTLKDRYYPNDTDWTIERGDALDNEYLSKYDEHDIVYSWGVLHHTGNMYQALENAGRLVKDEGYLYVAIYNDQGAMSKFWLLVKKIYNHLPGPLGLFISIPFFVILWTVRIIVDLLRLKPFEQLRNYKKKRGMSPWFDAVDWVGGYPFEVAKPEDIIEFYIKEGFILEKLQTVGGSNRCNHFLFRKTGNKGINYR